MDEVDSGVIQIEALYMKAYELGLEYAPKLALAILSGMSAQDFVICVQNNDSATLVRLPGVGKKTAERLVVEMRDRLDNWDTSGGEGGGLPKQVAGNSTIIEAEHALVSLGYKAQEASRMVAAHVVKGEALPPSEELIRLALKSIVKK